MILVIAAYPTRQNSNDGQIQRIKAMDEFMEGKQRVYLQPSIRQHFKKEVVYQDKEILALKINFIVHFFLLLRYTLKAKMIYAHTIYNLAWIIPFFSFIKRPIVLDVHGSVPEEILMSGDVSKAKRFEKIERQCFSKIDTAIFVTESMSEHFRNKYKDSHFESFIYGIYPVELRDSSTAIPEEEVLALKDELSVSDSDIVVIYAGGLSIWQNIEQMLESIQNKVEDEHIVYILLVSNKEEMKKIMGRYDLKGKRIHLNSVHPNELQKYYTISHYGFVLRDDNVVNSVANPTKLIEYLNYDITPIVKFADIGDFMKQGYDYITLDSFLDNSLNNVKNRVNGQVLSNIFALYKENFLSAKIDDIYNK